MAFRVEYDDTELRKLEIDLRGAPSRVQRKAGKGIQRAAGLVARGMRKEVGGHRYLKHLPNTVSHEMIAAFEAEIGLETKRRQGRLAHIMAYGSVNNGPVFDHTAPLTRLTPRIVNDLANDAEDSVLGDQA